MSQNIHFSIKCTDSTFNGCINFNLHCDVIPFSNPGSPDLFVTIDENCNAAYIFDDNYCKEDLQLFSVSNGNMYYFLLVIIHLAH